MRGRIVQVAGHPIELVPHRRMGALIWDAFRVGDPSGECLTVGRAFYTRRQLVGWLRSPRGEAAVREWLGA